jgi:hypothetical protein
MHVSASTPGCFGCCLGDFGRGGGGDGLARVLLTGQSLYYVCRCLFSRQPLAQQGRNTRRQASTGPLPLSKFELTANLHLTGGAITKAGRRAGRQAGGTCRRSCRTARLGCSFCHAFCKDFKVRMAAPDACAGAECSRTTARKEGGGRTVTGTSTAASTASISGFQKQQSD